MVKSMGAYLLWSWGGYISTVHSCGSLTAN